MLWQSHMYREDLKQAEGQMDCTVGGRETVYQRHTNRQNNGIKILR